MFVELELALARLIVFDAVEEGFYKQRALFTVAKGRNGDFKILCAKAGVESSSTSKGEGGAEFFAKGFEKEVDEGAAFCGAVDEGGF